MALFIKQVDPQQDPILTREQAQVIYHEYEKGLDETQQFTTNGTPFPYSTQVKEEIRRLEQEINTIMIGEQPKTQKELEKLLSSELLDVSVVVNDARRYADGTPEDEPTYEVWKSYFVVQSLYDCQTENS